MRFICRTFFDITATGVTGHVKSARIPFRDLTGREITDYTLWNYSRNQQRNLETITQIISMRTQLFDLTDPVQQDRIWTFEFETETDGVFGDRSDPTRILRLDSEGVPMIIDLDNQKNLASVLINSGTDQNIWFEHMPINN
jgi:hypothetical protein